VNAAAFGKVVQHRHAVVTDGRYSQTELSEFSLILIQLDQLGLAIWSPIRGPVEQNDDALGTQQTPQVTQLTILIRQFESTHPGAHGRAILASQQTVRNQ
jgi:hypothetical protein